MVATPIGKGGVREGVHGRVRQGLHASATLDAIAEDATHVTVDVSVHGGLADIGPLHRVVVASLKPSGTNATKATTKAVHSALRSAAADFLGRAFANEFRKVVDAYRVMLRESLVKGEDPALKAALNRARLQERILADTSMVEQAEACTLLGLSTANPSATMKRKEDGHEVLRFTTDGRAVYPLFQFDVEGRRLHPAMAQLIARKPKGWSDFRLLHWLTRPHLDMDGTPAEALGTDAQGVLAAFEREIDPPVHG
ncbi:hypothetical protein AFCDBAGC_0180 [Methylobacterium cerastii]|uniref:DUF2384 domain-containing protein n=2 Tax=Methylobacterium TaxID=407 RepID=A0ABQ4U586_9HYPH|nr:MULTISPECIES: hypothetical protein [Methylobacterium]GJD42344.1 hypothetical protein AFCDBAGC_0180 [Methylobacterium cerastii]GJE62312.1 hypothetical protein MPOCJGCO_4445 [Methylobacterium trifolii]